MEVIMQMTLCNSSEWTKTTLGLYIRSDYSRYFQPIQSSTKTSSYMVNKQWCSALFPGKLCEHLLSRGCPKIFHWNCYYGKPQVKTEQLYLFFFLLKDMSSLWNIVPLLCQWTVSQTKHISMGVCYSEYSEKLTVGTLQAEQVDSPQGGQIMEQVS